MAQDLTVNIKTTSDVPQAMDKAKSATVSFGKQVEDIQKKFSSSFKDIFLGFLAPMVLIQGAISMISEAIAKAKQDAKDGLDLLAKGDTTFATSEEKRMAAFFKRRAEVKEEQRLAEIGKSEIASQFIKTPEGNKLASDMAAQRISQLGANAQIDFTALRDSLKGDKAFQDAALKAFMASPEGKSFQPGEADPKATAKKKDEDAKNAKMPDADMKASHVSGNVIGVGANPVLSAIHEQVELAKQQLEYLRMIASKGDKAGPPADLTEKGATPNTPASPSRLSLLIPQK